MAQSRRAARQRREAHSFCPDRRPPAIKRLRLAGTPPRPYGGWWGCGESRAEQALFSTLASTRRSAPSGDLRIDLGEQRAEANAERPGQQEHAIQHGRVLCVLDPIDRLPVVAGSLGQFFLRDSESFTTRADDTSERQSALLHKRVLSCRHPIESVHGHLCGLYQL
jgi:hypothetical protein